MRANVFMKAGEAQQTISPLLYGHFIENLGKCIYGGLLRHKGSGWEVHPEVQESDELHPTVIRWPGGLFARRIPLEERHRPSRRETGQAQPLLAALRSPHGPPGPQQLRDR